LSLDVNLRDSPKISAWAGAALALLTSPRHSLESALCLRSYQSFRWSYLSSPALPVVECTLYLVFESHSLRQFLYPQMNRRFRRDSKKCVCKGRV